MTFRIGQKVRCIRRFTQRRTFNETYPQVGQDYTIRGFDTPSADGDFVYLAEIVNQPHCYDSGIGECSFWAAHFRPLTERKTDISVFTTLLQPSGTKELA